MSKYDEPSSASGLGFLMTLMLLGLGGAFLIVQSGTTPPPSPRVFVQEVSATSPKAAPAPPRDFLDLSKKAGS